MKKYLLIVMAVVSFMFITSVEAKTKLPDKTDHEKVTVYLFRGHGCSHCRDFLTYFISKYEKYQDYFEIVAYESWEDEANQKLMLAVKENLNEKADGSVPFIVIGDSYHVAGFSDAVGEEIIKEALKAYQDESYKDLVSEVAKKEDIKGNKETIKKAAAAEEIIKLDENGDVKSKVSDGVIVGIIFAVVILGFVGLVVFSRK